MARRLFFLLVLLGVFAPLAVHGSICSLPDSGRIVVQLPKSALPLRLKTRPLLLQYQRMGYLFARYDSVAPDKVAIIRGKKTDSVWLEESGFGQDIPPGHLACSDIPDWYESRLVQAQETGYPFATLQPEVSSDTAGRVFLKLQYDPGPYCLLDSVMVSGAPLSGILLRWAAGITRGMEYRESAMQLLGSRLAAMDGFSWYPGMAGLSILNGRLLAMMPVRRVAKDQFGLMAGLATSPVGRPVLTGELNGRFFNLFGSGVSAALDWKSFKVRSQEMKVGVTLPYWFRSPFVTQLQFGFEKYDTIYSNFSKSLLLKFPVSLKSAFVVGFQFVTRYRIFADEALVRNSHRLPDNPGSRNDLFHLGFDYSTLIPGQLNKKGIRLKLNGNAGFRTFIRDARLNAITWMSAAGVQESVFDSLQRVGKLRTSQYRAEYQLQWLVPVNRFSSLRLELDGWEYHAPVVYFNELGRYGGIKNLRGFNEQSIFANQMHMVLVEWQLFAGSSGYFGPFFNLAWCRNQSLTPTSGQGWLQGFGISSGLQTKAGVLQIVWALGRSRNQSFGLNNSKFHFGISNSF